MKRRDFLACGRRPRRHDAGRLPGLCFPRRPSGWTAPYPGCAANAFVEGARLFFPEEMPDLITEEAWLLWQARS